MGAKFGGDDDLIADINITPFVDIILVVLIIFMVTAVQITQRSIKVELPDAATGESTDSISLGITLTEDGGLLIDDEVQTPEQLRARLRAAKASGDDVLCLIEADEMVAHGRMVWLVDLIRSEEVYKYAINIDPAKALPPDPGATGRGRATHR